MWKLLIEIALLSLSLCCRVIYFWLTIRNAWSEAGLLSKDFFRCSVQGRVVWIGSMAILAAIAFLAELISP